MFDSLLGGFLPVCGARSVHYGLHMVFMVTVLHHGEDADES